MLTKFHHTCGIITLSHEEMSNKEKKFQESHNEEIMKNFALHRIIINFVKTNILQLAYFCETGFYSALWLTGMVKKIEIFTTDVARLTIFEQF